MKSIRRKDNGFLDYECKKAIIKGVSILKEINQKLSYIIEKESRDFYSQGRRFKDFPGEVGA